MSALALIIITYLGYIIAYHTYGKALSRRIFNVSDKNPVPSKTLNDGVDYVPTPRGVIFGHHFTSIAGTGPIVGPAIGVIWGWAPAVLWIFFGSIFMGAVHDFSALVISLRNQGKSIADITSVYINKRVQLCFFMIVCLALLIVIAIFGLVIAVIFAKFPQAVVPVWAEIPIAILLGLSVKKYGRHKKRFVTLAKIAFLGTFLLGYFFPLVLPSAWGIPATGLWTIILLGYAYIASTLRVTTLLQPRDYLNAWQLILVMLLLLSGVIMTGTLHDFTMGAPAFNLNPEGAPSMWPFLFITIACGAVSGFHSLVSSGTTSKQIQSELDARPIAFGGMLTEAALATLIIVTVTAGICLAYTSATGDVLTGLAAWNAHYGSWASSAGLGSKLTAVVVGASNILASLYIPKELGIIIMGVFIASFAGTTLDTATRIQRYVISELVSYTSFKRFSSKWWATGIAVLSGALLAFSSGADGKGALTLWPLFGAVNQLLAALALLIASLYLRQKGGVKWIVAGIPCGFMLAITLWAGIENQLSFMSQGALSLIVINGIILLLTGIMVVEAIIALIIPKTPTRSPEQSKSVESPKGCC